MPKNGFTVITIKSELYSLVKEQAIKEKTTISDIATRALRKYIESNSTNSVPKSSDNGEGNNRSSNYISRTPYPKNTLYHSASDGSGNWDNAF